MLGGAIVSFVHGCLWCWWYGETTMDIVMNVIKGNAVIVGDVTAMTKLARPVIRKGECKSEESIK